MAKPKTHRPGSKEWYKSHIRSMVREFNSRVFKMKSEGKKIPKQIISEINRLKRWGGKISITGMNRGDVIGLGFGSKPEKERLIRQYKELDRFLSNDVWTSEGKKRVDKEKDDAYKTFKSYHPNWSKDKWSDFVQLLGTAPTELLQAFGYEKQDSHRGSKTAKIYNGANESFVEAYSYAYDNDVDLFRVMEYTYREIEGEGYSQVMAIDRLKENIKHEIEEEKVWEEMWGTRRPK